MGEVYRARDTNLNRDVALKILPDSFAGDPDRLARFKREAQVLASLNHPNIAQIYGVEQNALVMELVEGEDLSQRLTLGAIAMADALPLARQIAEALEYAHEQGVVHRDLKPANIKVRADGTLKVLDFGLAKAIDPATSTVDAMNSPTLTARATALGTIIGTAAYMSPEQARGRAVDKRADVWAFGAVLFEMLTGRRAFAGEDVTDTLTAVMRDTPDWSALPPAAPPRLRRLLERCLERDVKQRLRDIGEARIEIAKIEAGAPDTAVMPAVVPATASGKTGVRHRRGSFALGAAAIVASLVTVAAMWWPWPVLAPGQPIRFTVPLPAGMHISGTQRSVVAVSPDGRLIAYTANSPNSPSALYVRPIDSFDSKAIAGSGEHAAIGPVFSPDGNSIAYFGAFEQTLQKVSITGGPPVPICPTELPSGLSWSNEGIVFATTEGIYKVSAEGGTPELLAKNSPSTIILDPHLLPGGKALLFTQFDASGGTERWDAGRIMVQALGSGQPKAVIENATDARYVASGHIVFARSGLLYAASFDVNSLTVTTREVAVVEGVMRATGTFGSGTIHLSVSDNGVLAYVPGPVVPVDAHMEIALFDFDGRKQTLPMPSGSYQTPRVSPDGRRIAFVVDDGRDANIWIFDVGTDRSARRLSFGGNNRSPIWTADSTRVAYRSDRDGATAIYWQAADGTGVAERLTPATKGTADWPDAFSPDGRLLMFDRVIDGRKTLRQLTLADRKESPVGSIQSTHLTGAVFSPDGRWIAYSTREAGRNSLMVEPFPPTGTKYQVSPPADDAHHPVWSPDGNDLFYTPGPGSRIMRVPVTRTPAFAFGSPTTLPRPFTNNAGSADRPYDVSRDGRQFLGVLDVTNDPGHGDSIDVVVNWFADLRAKVGR